MGGFRGYKDYMLYNVQNIVKTQPPFIFSVITNSALSCGIKQRNESCPRVTKESGSNLHQPSHSINLFLSTKSQCVCLI